MTRHGAFKLKKHNAFLFSFAICLLALLAGCKSAPEPEAADPLALIDRDAALYLYIPVQSHLPFVTSTLVRMTGMNEKDAERIASRTEAVYIAEETSRKRQLFQLSAKGSYPLKYVTKALVPEYGWLPQVTEKLSLPHAYYKNPQTQIEVALPSSSNALVSYQVEPQLALYEESLGAGNTPDPAPVANAMPEGFDKKVYEFLTAGSSTEIRFYERKADAFLQNMLGTDLKLPLKSVAGTLANAKKTDSEYDAKVMLQVADATPAKIKALVAGLKIALFPMPAKIQQTGTDYITISDISLSKSAFSKLLLQ